MLTWLVLATVAAEAPASAGAPVPRNWFVHANFGFNVYAFTAPATYVTPAQRVNLGQQVGAGYFVHPHVRVQLTLQFGETVAPASPSPFMAFAVLPLAVVTGYGLFLGVAPLLMPRAYGKNEFELGVFATAGYGWKLPDNFAIALAVQVPVTPLRKVTLQVSPLVSASYRF